MTSIINATLNRHECIITGHVGRHHKVLCRLHQKVGGSVLVGKEGVKRKAHRFALVRDLVVANGDRLGSQTRPREYTCPEPRFLFGAAYTFRFGVQTGRIDFRLHSPLSLAHYTFTEVINEIDPPIAVTTPNKTAGAFHPRSTLSITYAIHEFDNCIICLTHTIPVSPIPRRSGRGCRWSYEPTSYA